MSSSRANSLGTPCQSHISSSTGQADHVQRQSQPKPQQDLSTIQGDFIELPATKPSSTKTSSTPTTTSIISSSRNRRSSPSRLRLRSPSPSRQRHIDSPVHLHLSLTDSQMDKLTSAFSTGSPKQKARQRENRKSRESAGPPSITAFYPPSPNPFSTPVKNGETPSKGSVTMEATDQPRGRTPLQYGTPDANKRHFSPVRRSQSPSKNHENTRRHYPESPSFTLADRRGSARPSQTGVDRARNHRAQVHAADTPVTGVHHEFETIHEMHDFPFPEESPARAASVKTYEMQSFTDTSSIYSDDDRDGHRTTVSPLRIAKTMDEASPAKNKTMPQSNILRDYAHWRVSALSSLSHTSAQDTTASSPQHARGRSEDVSPLSSDAGDGGADDASVFMPAPAPSCTNNQAARNVFSPFPHLDGDKDGPAERKGRKVMIGHNGWLEHTGVTKQVEIKKPSPPKKAGGFLDALKKKAKEVVDMTESKVNRRAKDAERGRRTSRMRISLDPREQSLLYCEIEFLLTSALDDYLHTQFSAGRLDVDKYKKVVDHWQQQGRPKVVGFRYDLETQLNLVHLHLNQFKFYGDRSGAPVALGGVLDMMKVNSRAIRIRTFCQPDSVIAKQLLDSQSLLDILGSPENQQIQLAEIIQFFKVVLERARNAKANTTAASSSMPPPPLPKSAGRGPGQGDDAWNTPKQSPRH